MVEPTLQERWAAVATSPLPPQESLKKKHRHADLVDLHHDLHRDLDLGALHAQEGKHGEYGQQCRRRVRDDIRQRVVAADKD